MTTPRDSSESPRYLRLLSLLGARLAGLRSLLAVAGVLLLSVAASVGLWDWQRREETSEHQLAFQALVNHFQRDLRDKLEDYLGLLLGAAGLLTASDRITPREWADYVGQLNLPRNYPGLRAVAYVPRVPHAALDSWLRVIRAEQGESYTLRPAGRRDAYHPLALVEPPTMENRGNLGFDLASEPARRAALDHARDDADVAQSALLRLEGERRGLPALMMAYPVFRGRMVPTGAERRRQGLVGHVAIAFLVEDMMSLLALRYDGQVALQILDAAAGAGGVPLYDSDRDGQAHGGAFHQQGELAFGGRNLRLVFRSARAFDATLDRSRSTIVLAAGLAFSALMAMFAVSLSGAWRRAEIVARGMTRELRANEERFQLVVRGTVGGIWDWDLGSGRVYLSDRVEELLGYAVGSLDRSFGGLMRLLHPEDRGEVRARVQRHLGGAEALEADCRVQRADGNWAWFRLRGQAVWDAAGKATRMAGSFADIGRERQAADDASRTQAFLRRIIDNLPDPFTVKNEDLTILVANQAYSRFLGLPLAQIVGRRTPDFLPQGRGVDIEALDRLALRSGIAQTVPMDVTDGNQRVHHVLVKKVPCEGMDGGPALIGLFIDVTQEREALERFEAIIENAPTVAVQGFYPDGTVRHWNRAACAMYGYSKEQAVGRRMQDLLHAQDSVVDFDRDVARVLAYGAPLDPMEVERVLPDGRRIWVYTSMFPVLKDGRAVEIFCMEVDITERKRAEIRLRQSEARWQYALEGAGDGVWDWDVAQGRVLLSTRWKEMLGFAPEEIADSLEEWESRVHPDDVAATLEAVGRHLRGETASYTSEHRLRCKDGRYKWILDRGKVLERDAQGRALRFVGTHTDMTQRRLAEERIAESERRFRMLSDSAPVMIWMCDAAGWPTFVNKVWTEFAGMSEGQVAKAGWLSVVHPDDAPLVRDHFEDALAHGRPFEFEFRLRRADGVFRWVRDSGVPRFDDDGAFLGFVGSIFDVTERREAEDALRRSRDSLQDLVLEQTADLRRAKDAAEQANEAKSRFLANMSHELRTPMHAILSFARLGESRIAVASQDKIREYFVRIHASGERLLTLLNDLLDLSRLEAGRAKIEYGPLDLAALAEEARQELEALMAGRQLRFRIDCAPDLPPVRGDAHQIGRVIRNLLSNAMKFTPAGRAVRVVLGPERQPRCGGSGDAMAREAVEMVVSDQGIGIPEAELESVFDKFVQSSKTRSGAGGTGLGLAICREIVVAHGGEIFARGNADGGADIVVRLPAWTDRRAKPDTSTLELTT